MGLWSWFANRIDDLVNEPVDNVNNGVIANPFLVKKTPDADHGKPLGELGCRVSYLKAIEKRAQLHLYRRSILC
jgi:hypothetical protein